MSKIIYIVSRKNIEDSISGKLNRICELLAPDNITPRKPIVYKSQFSAYAILNPTETISIHKGSVLLGKMYSHMENWYNPNEKYPDGSYALFRSNEHKYEIVSDIVASRTIWYYYDEERLIASSSQRAIIMVLGNFEYDRRVEPWMLSTGSLGPLFSWDKRIKRLPQDSALVLKKKEWSFDIKSNIFKYININKSDKEHEESLKKVLDNTFNELELNFSKWILLLSGGYDSRGVLGLLFNNNNDFVRDLKTITWGVKRLKHNKNSDGHIAAKIANVFNISNEYIEIDFNQLKAQEILDRFVLLGEGRIDHISAYLDGFKIWKKLFESGVEGIIRGDENFGTPFIDSSKLIRLEVDYGFCEDYLNLKNYEQYGIEKQIIPRYLEQQQDESNLVYCDRLYWQFRLPIIQSALADLKLSYLEQITPLLSKKVMSVVFKLPDHLRKDKKLIKKIIRSITPNVGFSDVNSFSSVNNVLTNPNIINILENELRSKEARAIFSPEFLDFVLKDMLHRSKKKKVHFSNSIFIKRIYRNYVPRFLKQTFSTKYKKINLNPYKLAFRVFIIIKMNKILHQDSRSLKNDILI